MVLKLLVAGAIAVAVRRKSGSPFAPQRAGTVFKRIPDLKMNDRPIEPSWILEGAPVARAADHAKSEDDSAISAVWDCTAGTFRWYFGWDETVMILEGEVHVTGEDGSERTLKAGDIAYFPGKSWATWHIHTYVRKIAFCRKEFPAPVNMALKLRDRMRGGSASGGLAA